MTRKQRILARRVENAVEEILDHVAGQTHVAYRDSLNYVAAALRAEAAAIEALANEGSNK